MSPDGITVSFYQFLKRHVVYTTGNSRDLRACAEGYPSANWSDVLSKTLNFNLEYSCGHIVAKFVTSYLYTSAQIPEPIRVQLKLDQ